MRKYDITAIIQVLVMLLSENMDSDVHFVTKSEIAEGIGWTAVFETFVRFFTELRLRGRMR